MATKSGVVTMLMEKLQEDEEFQSAKVDDDGVIQLKPKHAKAVIRCIEELVNDNLREEEKLPFGNLVTFKLAHRKKRMGRNPATGESIKIPAKTVIKAMLPKAMRDEFNVIKKKKKK